MAYGSGGGVLLYGVVISDALSDPTTSVERLNELRDQARGQLDEIGDLAGALEKLEDEIGKRGGGSRY